MFLILLLTFTKNQVSIGMQLLELGGERNWGLFFIQQLDCTFAFSKQRVQSKVLTLYSILQLTFTTSQVAEQTKLVDQQDLQDLPDNNGLPYPSSQLDHVQQAYPKDPLVLPDPPGPQGPQDLAHPLGLLDQ